MNKRFYGGNSRNELDYGHNVNIQPMVYERTGRVRLGVAFALLLFVSMVGTSVIVAFS